MKTDGNSVLALHQAQLESSDACKTGVLTNRLFPLGSGLKLLT